MTMTPIPEEITYFQRPPEKTTISTEGYRYRRGEEEEVTVRFSYVGDTRNSGTQKTGQAFINNVEGSTVATKPNEPIQYVRLINVSGGYSRKHMWHVLIDDTYFVEMTDSTLMDAVQHSRAQDGKLYGPFIWARVSSGLRLIRIGGRIYNDLVQQTERIKTKAIRRNDLVVGNRYQAENGSFCVFLGDVDYEEYEDTAPRPAYNPFSYGRPPPPKPEGQYKVTEYKRRQLWLDCDGYKDRSYRNVFSEWEDSKENSTTFSALTYVFSTHTSRRIIKDLGQARNIPENPIDVFHDIMMSKFKTHNNPQETVDYSSYGHDDRSLRATGEPERRIPGMEYLYEHITERVTK